MQRKSTSSTEQRSADSPNVAILCTGGTFDKTYDPISESLELKGDPAARRILLKAQVREANVSVVTQKDSLDLTEEDLKLICSEIDRISERRIVIVHGTSRMVETANRVKNILDKTIIFTGAMVPSSIDATESAFNLGFALASARILGPGVWIAMSGEVFQLGEVTKNMAAGRFERL
jgi:L-asparaginase